MNLYVKCTFGTKKVVFFLLMLERLGFTLRDKNLLTEKNFSRTINRLTNRKHDNTLVFYQTIKQCSLFEVERIWDANAFPFTQLISVLYLWDQLRFLMIKILDGNSYSVYTLINDKEFLSPHICQVDDTWQRFLDVSSYPSLRFPITNNENKLSLKSFSYKFTHFCPLLPHSINSLVCFLSRLFFKKNKILLYI